MVMNGLVADSNVLCLMDTHLENLDFAVPHSSPRQRLQLTNHSFDRLGDLLPKLRKLSLEGCKGLTLSAFEGILRGCPLIMSLNVRRTNLEEGAYQLVAENCANRLVQLSCNFNATDSCAKHIAALHNLVELNLSGSKVQAAGIEEIAAGCPKLRVLNMDFVTIHSASAMRAIAKCCPNLQRGTNWLPLCWVAPSWRAWQSPGWSPSLASVSPC
jgi:Leucine-rich repeat (LRR) protein